MSSSIFYKFRHWSDRYAQTLLFDGNVLSVPAFRNRILALKFSNKKASDHHKAKQARGEELMIVSAKTRQVYADTDFLVKDEAIIIFRLPFNRETTISTTFVLPKPKAFSSVDSIESNLSKRNSTQFRSHESPKDLSKPKAFSSVDSIESNLAKSTDRFAQRAYKSQKTVVKQQFVENFSATAQAWFAIHNV